MKKLVSLLLVVFMCASLGVVLTSCGGSDPKTTVTADEFAAAFNLDDNWVAVVESENSAQQAKLHVTYKRYGNKIYAVQTLINMTDNSEESSEMYGEIADNVFYLYQYDEEAEAYSKMASPGTAEENLASIVNQLLPGSFNDFSKFEYSEENKNYFAESVAYEQYGQSVTASNVTIAFEDGKITSIAYSAEMQGTNIPYVISFTYGDASVTLPTVAAE